MWQDGGGVAHVLVVVAVTVSMVLWVFAQGVYFPDTTQAIRAQREMFPDWAVDLAAANATRKAWAYTVRVYDQHPREYTGGFWARKYFNTAVFSSRTRFGRECRAVGMSPYVPAGSCCS